MELGLFQRIVDELGQLGYAGDLTIHNSHDPLLNRRLHDEIRYVRTAAPAARPAIHSTGELLDHARLRRLVRSGLGYLRITRHPRYADTPPAYAAVQAWLRRTGLLPRYDWRYQPVRHGLAAVVDLDGCRVEMISPGTHDSRPGRWRAPAAPRPRTAPCLLTATTAVIDFHGRLTMCRHVNPRIPAYAQYLVGDLRTATFAGLWESPRMVAYRAAHARADWTHSPICAACAHGPTG
ncbi:SPASM domain-containing protein [Solwaraspora sp. WMMD1047]|uniref:SPASM domain-containing protein n=1 Tax=Solwaraspora sp. WMMD1047 TaxID=3016102 RepID=UPI0024163DCA|nr:SPASM domain-containing protein [Solwaraspora sp. WMMD1047]MDG4832517.1 SPASM domain-containing protein [Solwaraspora sp. WMMD1047]